jgi:Ca2+-binding EF-hand superfamily protein
MNARIITIPRTLTAALVGACLLAAGGCTRGEAAASQSDDVQTPAAPATPVAEPAPSASTAHGDVSGQFAKMDANGDGGVSADEHATGTAAMFATMDANGDGSVTVEEMDASQAAMGGDTRMTSADKIKVVDTDSDGALTRDEHEQGARTMFDQMDANHDGSLTQSELQAGHDARMGAQPSSG